MNDEPQVVLNTNYTLEIVKKASRFLIFPTKSSKLKILYFTLGIFGLAIFIFSVVLNTASKEHLAFLDKTIEIIITILVLVWTLMILVILIAYYIAPFVSYKIPYNFDGNFVFSLFPNKLTIQQNYTDKKPNGILTGNRFHDVELGYFKYKAESEDFIYLFITKNQYLIFPKSDFKNINDSTTFKNIINSNTTIVARKIQGKYYWNN